VQGEAYDYPDYFFQKRVHRLDRRPATEGMLADALALLTTKRPPLLVCGGGVKYSQAGQALREFAERFHIPFVETQAGKGTVPSSHPFNLGGIGETGCLAANTLAKQADLVIGVGTRYTDFTTSSKWLFQHSDVDFLNINVSGFDAGKLDGVQVLADARAALVALSALLAQSDYRAGWGDAIAEARSAQQQETARVYAVEYSGEGFVPEIDDHLDRDRVFAEFIEQTDSLLTQSRVLGVLNQHLPQDSVIVAAAGSLPGDLQRVWHNHGEHGYHVEYGYSCMGYEVNAALGVKLAEPQREVYAMVGDGAFMMLHSELVTSIQEGCKINVVLFDNMTNGCINNLQMEHGRHSYTSEFRFRNPQGCKLDGKLVPVNFAMLAAAYGCKTYSVTTEQQLIEALADARLQSVSTLLDIKVLPKTMVHKYLSWWRVGGAQVADSEKIVAVARKLQENIDKARDY